MQANAYRIVETSLGLLGLVGSPQGLKAVLGPQDSERELNAETIGIQEELPTGQSSPLLDDWADRLTAYAAGESLALDGPLDMDAGTEFQQAVWSALRDIPAGAVMTYGDVAKSIGRPRAARAVGQAVGANPLGIVVP